jgi:raffinose/stachyose/melibiose transport system substrate-binding protein
MANDDKKEGGTTMKRKLALAMAVCLTISALVGCGQTPADTQGAQSAQQESTEAENTEKEAAPEEDAQSTEAAADDTQTSGELPDVPVTIRFATQSMDRETSVMYTVLEQFQKDYPNVTLEIEESPGNDLITKINTDVMGDNTPDIFTFWRPESKWNVDKYIEKGAIADLTDWVNEDEFFTDLFPEYAWRTATVNDRIYCIPRLNFYVEFLVNQEIFEQYNLELPTDWDKLVTACDTLRDNGVIPWTVDTKEGLDDSSRIFNAIMNRAVGNSKGLELLKGNESFQQDDVIQACDYFLDVVVGNGPEDAAALDYTQAITKYLNTGKSAMILGNCSQIDVNLTDEILDKLVALDLPLTPESVIDKPSLEQDLTNLVYIGAAGFDDPDKQPYLKELMKRLTGRETARRQVEEERSIVPHLGLEVDESKITDLQREASAIAENSDGDKWLLSFAKAGPVDEFRRVINEAWAGKYASGEELAKALDDVLYGK